MAHKLNIFVSEGSQTIEGEVYFTGGGPAKNVEVTAFGPSKDKIAQTTTDKEGLFRLDIPASDCATIVARTKDGHRAEYSLKTETGPVHKTEKTRGKDTISIRDVVGGVGWIVGIAGIAFYIKARRDLKKRQK
jgi:nickel transport protein